MRGLICALAIAACFALAPATVTGAAKPLEIYFIDVEGGQATLIVDPRGPSLLVDTGWPDFDGRDTRRILSAAREAGLKRIDYVLITHYHRDHVGGVPELARQIKIGTFVDHGPNMEDSDDTRRLYADYQNAIGQSKHLVMKPGDHLPFKGIKVQILTAAGEHISSPLPEPTSPIRFVLRSRRPALTSPKTHARLESWLATDNSGSLIWATSQREKSRSWCVRIT